MTRGRWKLCVLCSPTSCSGLFGISLPGVVIAPRSIQITRTPYHLLFLTHKIKHKYCKVLRFLGDLSTNQSLASIRQTNKHLCQPLFKFSASSAWALNHSRSHSAVTSRRIWLGPNANHVPILQTHALGLKTWPTDELLKNWKYEAEAHAVRCKSGS